MRVPVCTVFTYITTFAANTADITLTHHSYAGNTSSTSSFTNISIIETAAIAHNRFFTSNVL